MNQEERNKKYNQYVEAKVPMTKDFPTLFYAFVVGGAICVLGQVIQDILLAVFSSLTLEEASGWVSIILIFFVFTVRTAVRLRFVQNASENVYV